MPNKKYEVFSHDGSQVRFRAGMQIIYDISNGRICIGEKCACAYFVSVDGGIPQRCLIDHEYRHKKQDQIRMLIGEICKSMFGVESVTLTPFEMPDNTVLCYEIGIPNQPTTI